MSDASELPSLTIKSGKGYEAMWVVPKGSPDQIKSWLSRFFDIPESFIEDKTPYEVAVIAEDIMQGRSNVATILGGTIITQPVEDPHRTSARGAPAGDPWANLPGSGAGAPQEPEDPHAGLRDQIAHATSREALTKLWAQNQDAFSDEKLLEEWKAKGKALAA